SWSQLYARRGARVEALQDLAGLRVAVLQGSVQERALQAFLTSFGLVVRQVPVASFDAGVRAVLADEADLVAVNHLYGNRHAVAAGLVATAVQFNPAALFFAA
ncbi:ABC transporter substrate-binding protein, partial [Aquabacterium sp. A08]|uniref:ABC transporter substrate-binding protein n=1 Tax=Aquabacterium sp. A08 TaxID=2718532 RepID=UPI001423E2C5